jgi:hypothetical protein
MKKIREIILVDCKESVLHKQEPQNHLFFTNACQPLNLEFGTKPVNLVILSEDEIVKGDTYIWMNNYQMCIADEMITVINHHVKNGDIKRVLGKFGEYKNVIGQSDCDFLGIPYEFIGNYVRKYNAGNIFDLVEVNYLTENIPLYKTSKNEKILKTVNELTNQFGLLHNNIEFLRKIYNKGQSTPFEKDSFRSRDKYLKRELIKFLENDRT